MVPVHGIPGSDYVLIARQGTADRPWDRLLDDVKSALTRLATTPGPDRSGKADDGPTPSDTPPQDR
jgi:ribonuclease P protein component